MQNVVEELDEIPLFFQGARGTALFGVLHLPARRTGRGAVFCHPYAEEKLWSHRSFVSAARRLAGLGIAVLRFDVHGHGDSDGMFSEATVQSAVEDTVAAAGELERRSGGLDEVALLGLRLGGAVACLAQPLIPRATRCVLWQPVHDGGQYCQEILRGHLAAQMAMDGKVTVNRKQLIEQLESNQAVNVEGYEFTPRMRRELEQLDLLQGGQLECRGLVVEVTRRPQPASTEYQKLVERFASGRYEQIQTPAFWRETREFVRAPEPLLGMLCQELGAEA